MSLGDMYCSYSVVVVYGASISSSCGVSFCSYTLELPEVLLLLLLLLLVIVICPDRPWSPIQCPIQWVPGLSQK